MSIGSAAVETQGREPLKLPVVPLVTSIVLGTLLSVAAIGGVAYYLIHSGKLRLQTMPPPISLDPKTHPIALDPLIVNLADTSGTAYLRVSLVLEVADAAQSAKSGEKAGDVKQNPFAAAARDAALTVLSKQTSEALLTPPGKDEVKVELKKAIAECNPNLKIVDLYFTEFLVQR
jgi:flagellar FliL protein